MEQKINQPTNSQINQPKGGVFHMKTNEINKTKSTLTISKGLQEATGKIDYTFTNDYMFRAILQKNERVLKALICAMLHMDEKEVKTITITNPIQLGEAIDNKEFILDINVTLNDDTVINLEMQVENLHNWDDRSLSYLCRSFDALHTGENYTQAKTAIHIGFLDFTPFPDAPEFYATYCLLNVKNHHVYSDKFVLSVVSLRQIELATDEDKAWKIDHWARLFKATTWEEIKMIAKKDPAFQEASETLYVMNSDETIRARCRAREDYYWMEQSREKEYERVLTELETANLRVSTLSSKLNSANTKVSSLTTENDTLHSENNTLHSELNVANSKLTDLMKYITEHGLPLPEDK
jgi:predicted transposase/invertase (TIGR01784 family)